MLLIVFLLWLQMFECGVLGVFEMVIVVGEVCLFEFVVCYVEGVLNVWFFNEYGLMEVIVWVMVV